MRGRITHRSIGEVDGRWRLFFHDTQLSRRNTFRSARVRDLVHNPDRTIETIDAFIRQFSPPSVEA